MAINLPDNTDSWAYEVTQELNTLTQATGDGSDVETGTDDQGRSTVGDVTIGYQLRYLETAYGTDANGANFAQTIAGLPTGSTTIYQGLRNQSDTTAVTNPASYVWRQLTVPLGTSSTTLVAYYRLIGGRDIDWTFETSVPTSFTADDGSVIDLEAFTAGQRGEAGADAIQTQITIRDTEGLQLTSDPATWPQDDDGQFFRNNMGDGKTLLATVFIGGVAQDFATHNTYTYSWTRNGNAFTPATASQALTNRYLQVTAGDVEDGGADQFLCTVTTPD